MMKKYVILSLPLLFSVGLHAQNKPSNPKNKEASKIEKTSKVIHVYSEIIEIPALKYAEIMTEPMTSTNQTKLRNSLINEVEAGRAKLISNQSITTSPGVRAEVESISEYQYPTEYDPAEVLMNDKRKGKTSDFQMVIEVEPSIGRSGYIDMTFKPEIVKHTGNHVMSSWDTEIAKVNVELPNIYTMALKASFTVYDNQFTLVGTYTPETEGVTDGSRKLLHFYSMLKNNVLAILFCMNFVPFAEEFCLVLAGCSSLL